MCKFLRKICRFWCIQFGLIGDLKFIVYDLELCVWSCVLEGVDFIYIEKNIYIQEECIIVIMRGRNIVLLILLFLVSFIIVYILCLGLNVL